MTVTLTRRLRNKCATTVHEKMWCAVGVSGHTPRRLPGDFISGKRNDISEQGRNTIIVQSRMMFATNSSFDLTSSRCFAASALTKMNASSWRKGRLAILYEVQVGNRILRSLQIVDQAVARLVVQEGLLCFLLQRFQYVRHTVFCTCASLL